MDKNGKVCEDRRHYAKPGITPYGWKRDPNSKGYLIKDENEWTVVERIIGMFLAGEHATAMESKLNSDNVPPRGHRGGKFWNSGTIITIIRREFPEAFEDIPPDAKKRSGSTPRGWKIYDKNPFYIIRDDKSQEVIGEILRRSKSGETSRQIAGDLQGRGIVISRNTVKGIGSEAGSPAQCTFRLKEQTRNALSQLSTVLGKNRSETVAVAISEAIERRTVQPGDGKNAEANLGPGADKLIRALHLMTGEDDKQRIVISALKLAVETQRINMVADIQRAVEAKDKVTVDTLSEIVTHLDKILEAGLWLANRSISLAPIAQSRLGPTNARRSRPCKMPCARATRASSS